MAYVTYASPLEFKLHEDGDLLSYGGLSMYNSPWHLVGAQ